MNEGGIAGISNYRELDAKLSCSGQPSERQFEAIAEAGFEVVINLGVCRTYTIEASVREYSEFQRRRVTQNSRRNCEVGQIVVLSASVSESPTDS